MQNHDYKELVAINEMDKDQEEIIARLEAAYDLIFQEIEQKIN